MSPVTVCFGAGAHLRLCKAAPGCGQKDPHRKPALRGPHFQSCWCKYWLDNMGRCLRTCSTCFKTSWMNGRGPGKFSCNQSGPTIALMQALALLELLSQTLHSYRVTFAANVWTGSRGSSSGCVLWRLFFRRSRSFGQQGFFRQCKTQCRPELCDVF